MEVKISDILDSLGVVFDESNLKNLDEECLRDNVGQLKDLMEKFPVVRDYADKYSLTFECKDGVFIGNTETNTAVEYQKLQLNPIHYKTKRDYILEQRKAIKTGYKMPFDDNNLINYSITHEFGHILENCLIKRYQTDNYAQTLLELSKIHDSGSAQNYMIQHYKHVKKEILKAAHELDGDINDGDYRTWHPHLSDYGKISPAEFFAECFVNSQSGNANILGRAMNEFLKGEVN